ncbi:FecR domain-containing protein [Candidatus Woesearchaeota archaeon]|nr:FecR domain-containing protein [Candidatus Woesearchaeota archaeon]
MNKLLIALGVLILVIGVGAYMVLVPPSPTDALLYIERGTVEVNLGSGWQAATHEMELTAGNAIRTTDGEALVVIRESEFVYLEPNTELSLDEVSGKKVMLTQAAGETWNKVNKLTGVEEFEVKTPNTVATVRGTSFIINDNELLAEEGVVDFASGPQKVTVKEMQKALRSTMEAQSLTPQDRARFDKYKAAYLKTLKILREREIQKRPFLIKAASTKGYSYQKILDTLEQVDNDPNPVEDGYLNKVPSIYKPQVDRIYKLTKEIKNVKKFQLATASTSLCARSGKCRIWAACGQTSDQLMTDGLGTGCVDAYAAASASISYCGHFTVAQGGQACNYQDKTLQQRCICP